MLRIKEVLQEKGITQESLAQMVDSDRVSINRIVNGKSDNPGIKTLSKIANALNVDIRDLFETSNESQTNDLFIRDHEGYKKVGTLIKS